MLELDYHHRCRSSLSLLLRGKLRWVAAHANHSAYGEAYAITDLTQAGLDRAGLRALAGDRAGLPADERAALAFADKLIRAADTVTDAEVATLLHHYGERQVVAMVLLLAYANFQDRLVLALHLPVEAGGPLKPVQVRFRARPMGASRNAPPRSVPAPLPAAARPVSGAERKGQAFDYAQLRQALEKQRQRRPRIALPADQPAEIHWGLVCRTYQPELAAAWSACSSTFEQEADLDPVFGAQLLWVTTGALRCFY
jgi:hypothetical protein